MDILFALKTSLIICGLYACTWDGMVFGNIRSNIDTLIENNNFLIWLSKPIYSCVICMASLWGGSAYLFSIGLNLGIIPHVFLVAGINTLISGIIFLAYERNTNQ